MTIFATDIVESSSTTGTSTYTLNGPATGYRGFAAGYVTGDTPYYVVRNVLDTKYEINRFGIFTEGTPDTLSRSVYLSSNGNAAVSWLPADLPLLVYVPSANEVFENLINGFRATAKSVYLRYGLWFRKDYPSANNDTLMIWNGAVDIPFATINNVSNTATALMGLPPGIIMDFGGDVAPAGTVLCYGQSLSRTTYAALYSVILVKYGSVDGASFNVPDLRGRAIFGKDNMGGVSAGRITAINSWVPTTLGSAAGAETGVHTVTVSSVSVSGSANVSGNVTGTSYGSNTSQIAIRSFGSDQQVDGWGGASGGGPLVGSHTHWQDLYNDPGVNGGGTYGTMTVAATGTYSGSMAGTSAGTGTGSGTTNTTTRMPPGMILNKIISTGGV